MSDHADRDAVLQAFALSTPYHAAQALGLAVVGRASPRMRRVSVRCPWHAETSPGACALTLKRGRLVAHCASCHGGGDVLSIVAALEGLDARRDFAAVLARAAELVGVDLSRERVPRRHVDATPLERAQRELAEARRESERLAAELRATRADLALAQAEGVARADALGDVVAGLSDELATIRAGLPALRRLVLAGDRRRVLAALDRLDALVGAESEAA